MRKEKVLSNILFWITLISPMLAFALASIIGESNIFGVAGIVRYSWIMWLFIPVGVLSIIIGIKLKKEKKGYKKNLIIAFICLPLILIFGSYRFIFTIVSYDIDKVVAIEEKINLDLPNEIKIATTPWDTYDVSYVKIINDESKDKFEQELKTNPLWQNELSFKIKNLLPLSIPYETEAFDYFVFYNVTTNEYNEYPLEGECECIFIAYDCETQRLIIVDNYKIR